MAFGSRVVIIGGGRVVRASVIGPGVFVTEIFVLDVVVFAKVGGAVVWLFLFVVVENSEAFVVVVAFVSDLVVRLFIVGPAVVSTCE